MPDENKATPRKFDQEKYLGLINEKSKIEEQRGEISVQLHDEYESDAWDGEDGPAKLARYQAKTRRYETLGNDVMVINSELAALEALRPAQVKGDALEYVKIRNAWLMGGEKALGAEERNDFLVEPTPEMVRDAPILGKADGSIFDPFALIDPSVWLAATDPYRSDTNAAADPGASTAAPEEWLMYLVRRHKYFGAVANVCYNFDTSHGNTIHSPQKDSTNDKGEAITGQAQAAGGVPGDPQPPASTTEIEWIKVAWRSSKFMPVRIETEADLLYDIAGETMMDGAERLGRGWNEEFTVGVTPNRPNGIVTECKVIDGGAGSAYDGSGGIDYANILDTEYGIDRAYRVNNEGGEGGRMVEIRGGAGWMFHDTIEKNIQLAIGPGNVPLWTPNRDVGAAAQGIPGQIKQYPYVVNNDMADGTANNHLAMIFGKFMHYGVRNVGGPLYFRFFDRTTAAKMSIDFLALSRRDGRSRGPIVGGKCDALAVLQVKS